MNNSSTKPKIVYHYCSLETFFNIISKATIRLSDISKSNDTEEVVYLLPKIKKFCVKLFEQYNDDFEEEYKFQPEFVSNMFDSKFIETSLKFYVMCFSREADLLSQWRGYAADASGISIGFSTEPFYLLSSNGYPNYQFSKVRYSLDDLYNYIEEITTQVIKEQFSGDYKKDSLVLMNLANDILSMILYSCILYKNPSFNEEKEWRLVYNPFGNIRRIINKMAYYDRISEMFSAHALGGGFMRTPMEFRTSRNQIISYIDLSFANIKNTFIKEIIIGSKAKIKDFDLELFLLSKGFDPVEINIRKSDIPYR